MFPAGEHDPGGSSKLLQLEREACWRDVLQQPRSGISGQKEVLASAQRVDRKRGRAYGPGVGSRGFGPSAGVPWLSSSPVLSAVLPACHGPFPEPPRTGQQGTTCGLPANLCCAEPRVMWQVEPTSGSFLQGDRDLVTTQCGRGDTRDGGSCHGGAQLQHAPPM